MFAFENSHSKIKNELMEKSVLARAIFLEKKSTEEKFGNQVPKQNPGWLVKCL